MLLLLVLLLLEQVDLRGCLGARSLLRPLLDALGWVDAYVERMLMAVILVKDEVGGVGRWWGGGGQPHPEGGGLPRPRATAILVHAEGPVCRVRAAAVQVEQQRFLVQPFSMLTNNHAARSSSSALMSASGASSAGGAAAAGGLEIGRAHV